MRRAAVPQHIGAEKLKSLEIGEGVYDFTSVVIENITSLGLDYLVVIGGDDTSRAETCLAMLRKSKTIGDYLAAREKAGLGTTLGGYLPGWIEKGYVSVGKGKPAKAAKPAKVEA